MKYRKKPVVIEAIRLTTDNFDVVCDFMGGTPVPKHNPDFGIDENGNTNEPYLGVYIETLEGKMLANYGDYIIKGVNGEFYPCKPDIFEKTYDKADDSSVMGFGDAIEVLKQGGTVRRSGWNGKGLMVFKQVPAHIESDIIPKMQSLSQSAKDLILRSKGFIDYTSQCLIYNENNGRADSWVPSISDVFAEDWEIVE
ncbi:DUF2829 domain-containing protein [Phocaeicola vulgatus]|jgi:hypothetical protein|uniref:Thoeris anti-defense 2-like domain-containing protein n=1 Tax=Siphoviridae sp. ct47y1 TaxID=2827775 RepID=A0A8S5T8W0_9CAUD|nr:DUF2829 domain-containing protein [Phocaeicola vulgatus]MDC1720875.1 DUF2829 domain-containing protein [Phocaeicola vulgatus]MDC1737289.1 DUF2829 domain-containing protein [Phocaeicola vulgatus]DAF59772.1 MAG TPA: Protein of unknown function (DUF2829) [Siphoviridae sp. ct47y1]